MTTAGAAGPARLGEVLAGSAESGHRQHLQSLPWDWLPASLARPVRALLEPLQGGQTYDVQKRMYLPQTSMPRIGEVWPSWFNPANPNEFAVGQPNAYTQESLQVLREFGIATPFDPPRS